MSLGWQSESALLPRKAIPIKVDGSSMEGLKALMSNGNSSEAARKPKKYVSRANGIDLKTNDKVVKKKPIEKSTSSSKEEERAALALAAKAKLYDQILAGKSNLSSNLVDFSKRAPPPVKEAEARVNESISPPPPPPSRPLPRPATMTLQSKIPEPTGQSFYCAPTLQSPVVSTQPHYNWSTTYNTNVTSSSFASSNMNTNHNTDTNTNTSTDSTSSPNKRKNISEDLESHHVDYNSAYLDSVEKERQLKRAIDELIRVEEELRRQQATTGSKNYGSGGSSGDCSSNNNSNYGAVSEAARIKTMWEKTLNSSARSYLDEIHEETVRIRQRLAAGKMSDTSNAVSNDAVLRVDVDVDADIPTELVGQKRSYREEEEESIRLNRIAVENLLGLDESDVI